MNGRNTWIFALIAAAALLAPSSALAFSDSQPFMINLVSDAVALGPRQVGSSEVSGAAAIRDAVSRISTKTKHGRRDPDEHFNSVVEMFRTSARTPQQRFEELVALSVYLVNAVSPNCPPKFYNDLMSSPDVFIAVFDGQTPIQTPYSDHLKWATQWSQPYRSSLDGACRYYNPRNSRLAADNTAIVYNFLVNELVDVWSSVLYRANQLRSPSAEVGTRRTQKPGAASNIVVQLYRPSDDLDVTIAMREFRRLEQGGQDAAAAPAPLQVAAVATTTTTTPTTTTTRPIPTTVPPPPTTIPLPATTTTTVFTPTTTLARPTTTIAIAMAATPAPAADTGVIELGGLEITSEEAEAAKEKYGQDTFGIREGLDPGAKINIDTSGVDASGGNRVVVPHSSMPKSELQSGDVTVEFDALGQIAYVPIGEKQESRIVLGALSTGEEQQGAMSPEAVLRVISANLGGVRSCYERSLKYNPNIAGRFFVQITVGADGSVANVEVLDDTLRYGDLTNCLVKRVYAWRFPAPMGGRYVFSYPFTFVQSF
ncbi:AgmX/PglI C-terminal domain-containing protein [bacterium]|nr:AgmX/PglI C-terminal domain-containing protein [bacterium]